MPGAGRGNLSFYLSEGGLMPPKLLSACILLEDGFRERQSLLNRTGRGALEVPAPCPCPGESGS